MNHLKICPINLQCESVSSQAVCHSFILALLGMVIGSQSTSNGWIGPQLVWLRASAVSARVHSFVFGVAWPCTLALFAHHCLHTTERLCHSISPPHPPHLHLPLSPLFPSLIWIWSSLNHRQHCCATVPGSQARRAERYSCEQVFLTLPSNYYQDTAECNPGGNERSCWCGKSSCSHRLASVGAVSRGRRGGGTFTFFMRGCECLVLMFVHTWRPYMNPSKVFLKISKCNPNSVNSLYQEMQFFCPSKSDLWACHS